MFPMLNPGFSRSILQDAIASDDNSSEANIAGLGSFTGVAASTLGVNSIQVSLKTDKNCLVYVEQSPDGVNWDLSDVFDYFVSINNFGVTVQAISSWFRVRVVNRDIGATTHFRLQSVLCPMAEPLPRALDEFGNLKVGVKSIADKYGFEAENTPMGDMRTVEPVRLVGAVFGGTTLDGNFWLTTGTAGTGSVTIPVGAECVLNTGAAGGTAIINSVRIARYIGGNANRYRAVVRVPDVGAAGNIRRWGAFDASNGAFFELDATGFKVVTRKGGVDTPVLSGAFNGTLGATFLPGTSVRTYEIYWTNSSVWFVVGGEVLHKVEASASTWGNTMALPVRAENAGGNNLQLLIRVQTIYRLGPGESRPQWRYQSGAADAILKYGPGTLHRVVVNDAGGTSVTLYDNVAGAGSPICLIDPSGSPVTLEYNLDFYTGLHMVSVGAVNVTIIYE